MRALPTMDVVFMPFRVECCAFAAVGGCYFCSVIVIHNIL